jgi:hypothetical protein
VTAAGTPFTVVLPQGLTKIGDGAFAESALASVVIPDSVTEIGANAFYNCSYYANTGSADRSIGRHNRGSFETRFFDFRYLAQGVNLGGTERF